ncbi:beta-N-acetylhexosaminidase [Saccharophagus sp. K07]|uniref:beta-N-acetylhexosaminidase n=1 Tax=Saccharophagus sp. K07 TaxID=2283636 RepID=UPI001651F7F2|nr:beta-N-acetylhexosaminidase [Saccharophagus sp. K07]MBC6904938.1 beta-N-acetylhexosaminidase [Saccharophagus sp. K07]
MPSRSDYPLGPVVLDIAGTELQPEEAEVLQHPQVGGLILFSRNFESPEQLCYLVGCVRSVRPNLLLAVDQEGGRVQRFKSGFTRLPALRDVGDLFEQDSQRAIQTARELGWLMASEVRECGVDISFAPVVDADDAFGSVIGDRAFSPDFAIVAELAKAYIGGMGEAGMAATLKHFPGHGAVEEDSHEELPVDERSFEEVWEEDMRPFRALLPLAGAVMPAHILFASVDPNPVGFSSFWLQKILRHKLGFGGIIFSDDLSMEGASVMGDHCDRAEAALAAGCDAVLVCNKPAKAIEVIERLNAVAHPANNRLSLMCAQKATPSGSPATLQKAERWRRAVALAETLL